LTGMGRRTWQDFGPDVEYVRQQMAVQPPDPDSIEVEDDGERITAIAWTHKGQRCSVSTPIVTEAPASGSS
jgi:hypothetical protein